MIAPVLQRRQRITELNPNRPAPAVPAPGNIGLQLADTESEQAVVSAVLQAPEVFALVAEMLEPGDFFWKPNAYFWLAFERLTAKNTPIDFLNAARELDAEPTSPIKGAEAITQLTRLYHAAPRAANAVSYAQRVRDAATRLRIMQNTDAMRLACVDPTLTIEALTDQCNKLLFAATDQRFGVTDNTARAVISRYQDILEARMNNRKLPGVMSGWPRWDDPVVGVGGSYPGDVTVVAGKEGFGKTTWELSHIRNVVKTGKRAVFFSLEMREEEIMAALVSMETGIPKTTLRSGNLNKEQWGDFLRVTEEVSRWPLLIVDEFRSITKPLTPTSLRRKLRMILAEQTVDLLAIDGLWLMRHDKERLERRDAVSEIMADLSDVAKGDAGLPMPVHILHQYNAEVGMSKKVKRPTLYHLAESAGVRRNAQVVIGLWRNDGASYMECHLLKDRNGGNAGFSDYFNYDKAHSLYEEQR